MHAGRGQQFGTERGGRIRSGDRVAATSLSNTETEDLLRHTGRKSRSEFILQGIGSDGTCIGAHYQD